MLYNFLLDSIFTKTQANELVEDLGEIRQWKDAKEILPYDVYEAWEKIIKNNKINISDNITLSKLITDVEDYITKLPIVRITLAFSPKESFVKSLTQTLRDLSKQSVLLEIVHDQTQIGGAVFEYKGKYKDLSLREKITNYFSH